MRRYDKYHCPRLSAMGLAAVAAIVLLCAVRGCIISRQPNEKPEGMLSISLYDRASGKTEEMPLEEYLIGVVGAEMPASLAASMISFIVGMSLS